MVRSAAIARLFPCVLIVALSGCDNVARAFDPDGRSGGPAGESTVQAVPAGGDARDGRPQVREVLPEGDGWPVAVPIVVEFSESMNESTVVPDNMSGRAGVYVQQQGTTTPLPAAYDFLLGGRVLVIRPTPELSNAAGLPYEVVVDPDVRDVDGVSFGGSEPEIIAEFTVDEITEEEDGRILTILPRDNEGDIPRETEVYCVFTKPANTQTVTAASFRVETGGVPFMGTLDFPFGSLGGDDGRVVEFRPASVLPGESRIDIVVDASITFGTDGVLDFGNRTPFGDFDTLAPEAAVSVIVGNAMPGFADKINLGNFANLQIDVTAAASAAAGDQIAVRMYGLDAETELEGDLTFVERSLALPIAGAQTVNVDFSGALGTAMRPVFEDGPFALAVQLQRGSRHTGFVLSDAGNDPRIDITPPSLAMAGPPGIPGTDDVLTDQEQLVFYGTADEEIGDATLTDGTTTVGLFAASGPRFCMEPVLLGRLTAPATYSLTLTDVAGNMGPAAITGRILQRGVITGSHSGTVTVEAYDEATLAAVVGATVVLDPGTPMLPAVGQLMATTDTEGRATLTSVPLSNYTVTLVAAGYHLRTLYDTGASHASLPLRPVVSAVATFDGTAAFAPVPNTTALIGSNVLDDPRELSIATSSADPRSIPATAIRPDRPQVLTAFAGTFEPTTVPTFTFYGCQMCGVDAVTPTPPAAPAAPGDTSSETIALLPATGAQAGLLFPYSEDFANAAGLDVGNLVSAPVVRVTTSLVGFGGQTLTGVGLTNATMGADYTINASYSLVAILGLQAFAPVSWIATQAEDIAGNISRHRVLLSEATGTVVDAINPVGIPTVTAPGGPATGSPAVTYQDRLDAATVPGGLAIGEIVAIDGAGRQWSLLFEDLDGATGADTVQFPDLSAVVGGLVPGVWRIHGEGHLYLSTSFTFGDIVLEERRRMQVAYTRSTPVDFTVN